MDIAHNKISQELPFDAVANQINSSITSYKDGKDQHLVNGTTDIAMKKSIVEEFYTKLKKDLLTYRENEIKSNGTEIGSDIVSACVQESIGCNCALSAADAYLGT